MKSTKLSRKTNIYKKLRQIYFCILFIPVTALLLSAGFSYLLNIAFIHQPSTIPYLMSFQTYDIKANELIYFVNNLEQFSVFMLGLALLWLLINSPVVAFFSINWFENHLERNSPNTDQTSIKNEKTTNTTNTTNPDKDYFVANLVRLSIGLPRKK